MAFRHGNVTDQILPEVALGLLPHQGVRSMFQLSEHIVFNLKCQVSQKGASKGSHVHKSSQLQVNLGHSQLEQKGPNVCLLLYRA